MAHSFEASPSPHITRETNSRKRRRPSYTWLTALAIALFFQAAFHFGLFGLVTSTSVLYRLNAQHWEEVAVPDGYLISIGLGAEDQLWLTLLGRDGNSTLYRQALNGWDKIDLPADTQDTRIRTTATQVWAFNGENKIFVWNGSAWQTETVPKTSNPWVDLLHYDSRGTVWMQDDGKLFLRADDSWQKATELPPETAFMASVGEDSAGIWFFGQATMLHVSFEGKLIRKFKLDEYIPGSDLSAPRAIAVLNGSLIIQSDNSIYSLRGEEVVLEAELPPIPEGNLNLMTLPAGAGGYWALAAGGSAFGGWLLPVSMLCFLLLIWWFEKRAHSYFQNKDEEPVQEILKRNKSTNSQTITEPTKKASLLSRFGVRFFRWGFFVLLLIAYIPVRSYMHALTGGAIPEWVLFIAFLFLMNVAINMIVLLLSIKWVLSPHMRGRHDAALRRLAFVKEVLGAAGEPLECLLLYKACRYDEAERLATEYLAKKHQSGSAHKTSLLAAYGLSLLGQRKFSDAVQTLEAALELESDNKIIVSALAECYLQEGNRYDKAIELLQPHVQANPVSSKTSILDLRSKFAWALAQAGRIDASKAEINFVLEHSDGKPQNNALFNLMAGHVFLLAREASKAAAFFEVAFENDPNGVTGVEAKRMLEVGLRRSLSGPVGRQPERSSPVS